MLWQKCRCFCPTFTAHLYWMLLNCKHWGSKLLTVTLWHHCNHFIVFTHDVPSAYLAYEPRLLKGRSGNMPCFGEDLTTDFRKERFAGFGNESRLQIDTKSVFRVRNLHRRFTIVGKAEEATNQSLYKYKNTEERIIENRYKRIPSHDLLPGSITISSGLMFEAKERCSKIHQCWHWQWCVYAVLLRLSMISQLEMLRKPVGRGWNLTPQRPDLVDGATSV